MDTKKFSRLSTFMRSMLYIVLSMCSECLNQIPTSIPSESLYLRFRSNQDFLSLFLWSSESQSRVMKIWTVACPTRILPSLFRRSLSNGLQCCCLTLLVLLILVVVVVSLNNIVAQIFLVYHPTSSLTCSVLHRSIQQFPSRRLLSLYRWDVLHRSECGECMLSGRNLCGEMRSRWCCGMRRFSICVSSSFRVADECISGVVC